MLSLEPFFGLLAPWSCLVCEAEGQLLCWECCRFLAPPPGCCYRCRRPVTAGALCPACRPETPLSSVSAACQYGGLSSDLLHKFKFERAAGAARTVAGVMAVRLPRPPSLIVPIPTASRRVRQRGYDQAVLLARELSRSWSLPYARLLARQGQQRQLGADRARRQSQLVNAWRVRQPSQLFGKHVVLVDDVLTTGATIEAAASLCARHGAASVSAITFAQKV